MVSSFRSLLAVISILPKPTTPNSFSITLKIFLASIDKYAKSPESNLIPDALYLYHNKFNFLLDQLKEKKTEFEKNKKVEHSYPKLLSARATAQKLGSPLRITW